MPETKFRSIQAFRQFEQKAPPGSAGRQLGDSGEALATVSPIHVLAAVKRRPDGVSRVELVRQLGGDAAAVDTAILRLLKEELVVVRQQGEGEERVFAA